MGRTRTSATYRTTLCLAALAIALGAIFRELRELQPLSTHVPEFTGLMLLAGILYLAGVWLVLRARSGVISLLLILGVSAVLRAFCLPSRPTLSEDVYRYQWEGRIERAGLNPYNVYPEMSQLRWAHNPGHPLTSGSTVSTIYPPLSEKTFAAVKSIFGYKRLFTAFDLASIAMILLLLAATNRPLNRVLVYAWNPAVIISFSLSGHNGSLAILLLLVALLLIIKRQNTLSMTFLGLAVIAKLFPIFVLPAFFRRLRWPVLGAFGAVLILGYLPFLRAGTHLFHGISRFAAGWEANDSFFRLVRLAGNSQAQAELVSGILLISIIAYTLRSKVEPLRASLIILTGLLLLSPSAFPWYFTWIIPFLCFDAEPALLLLSVTCVLGYSPVVAYSAGLPYRDLPLMLALEYVPVYGLLAWRLRGLAQKPQAGAPNLKPCQVELESY